MAKKIRRKSSGGGGTYKVGTDISGISNFAPSSIPGLCLWIKADSSHVIKRKIKDYAEQQPDEIKEKMLDIFKFKLNSSVITEITSDTENPNSLIRLEDDLDVCNTFPTLKSGGNILDTIDISNLKDPLTSEPQHLKLITKLPILLPEQFSSYTISHGIMMKYVEITSKLLLTTEYVETPTTTLLGDNQIPVAIPTAEFSEIIVYDRVLDKNEHQQLEGYLAYKQNNQYLLPTGHPYLPNMMDIPALKPYGDKFTDIEKKLKSAEATMEVAIQNFGNKDPTKHNSLRNSFLTTLFEIKGIREALSRGALLADPSLDGILKAVNDYLWWPVNLTTQQLDFEISKYTSLYAQITEYTVSLTGVPIFNFLGGGISQNDAQIEDYVNFTEQDASVDKFYYKLRETSKKISLAGWAAYSPLYTSFQSEISVITEAFNYKFTKNQTTATALIKRFETIAKEFEDGSWKKKIPFIDTTEVNGVYKESTLNDLYGCYVHANQQLTNGTHVYLQELLRDNYLIFDAINKLSAEQKIHPILRTTYIPFLKQVFKASEKYFQVLDRITDSVNSSCKKIEDYYTNAVETKMPSVIDNSHYEEPPYEVHDIYVRRVLPMDTLLTGVEYVITDSDGILHMDSDEVHYIFPKFIEANFENKVYERPTALRIGDHVVQQVFIILEPLTVSILDKVSESIKPIIHSDALILREHANKINIFESPSDTIILPKFALDIGAYFLIYASGKTPISVRNPGKPDSIDNIGPGEAILYIYTDYTDDTHTYYGRVRWAENQLPYDTLFNCPRSSLCTFVPDLNETIYVCKVGLDDFKPLYDTEGQLVKVVKHTDGNIYDIDDVFHSNPYSSVLTVQKTLTELNAVGKQVGQRASSLYIHSNNNGLPLLSTDPNGSPIINDFGYAKVVQTMIQYIHNTGKIRGAYGDIIVEFSKQESHAAIMTEPFLSFNSLFRSRFIKKCGNGYVFVTNSAIPILSPKGELITVPDCKLADNLYTYTDIDGTHDVFLVDNQQIIANLPMTLYPYRDIKGSDFTLDIFTKHFNIDKMYIESLLNYLSSKSIEIQELGKEETKEVVEIIRQGVATLTQNLDEFSNYSSSITNITSDTNLVLETLGLKLKEILKESYEVETSTKDAIKTYTTSLDEIKDVKQHLSLFENDTRIEGIIHSIESAIITQVKERGTTGAPDIERLLKMALITHGEYKKNLEECREFVLSRPEHISEIHKWYTSSQIKFEKLNELINGVVISYKYELPLIISVYKKNSTTTIINTINKYKNEIETLNSIVNEIKVWIESGKYPSFINGPLISDLQHYIKKEEDNVEFLLNIKVPMDELRDTVKGREIPVNRDTSSQALQQNEVDLRKILDEFKPVVKGYQDKITHIVTFINNMYLRFMKEDKGRLEGLIISMRTKWIELTSRRTAFETAINFNNGSADSHNIIKTIDALFVNNLGDEIEGYSKELKLIITNSKLQELENKIHITDAKLDSIGIELQKMSTELLRPTS
jgi:hypothetical protein